MAVDYFRYHIEWIQKWFGIFFSSMLRKHELEGKLTGATWAFIGGTISVFIFEKSKKRGLCLILITWSGVTGLLILEKI